MCLVWKSMCLCSCWNKIICSTLGTRGSFQHLVLLLTGRTETWVSVRLPKTCSSRSHSNRSKTHPGLWDKGGHCQHLRWLLGYPFPWYNKKRAESWVYVSYQLKVWKGCAPKSSKWIFMTEDICFWLLCGVRMKWNALLRPRDLWPAFFRRDTAETHATAASLFLSFSLSFVPCYCHHSLQARVRQEAKLNTR